MADGHGAHKTGESEISRRPCKCGLGFVIDFEEYWDSDWKGESTEYRAEHTCPNKCEKVDSQADISAKKVLESIRFINELRNK